MPNLEVRLPIPIPDLSSARYSTYILLFFTAAAGLNTSPASQATVCLLIGSRKTLCVSGERIGLTVAGLIKGPIDQPGSLCCAVANRAAGKEAIKNNNRKAILFINSKNFK